MEKKMEKAESMLREIFREREKFFRDLTYLLITSVLYKGRMEHNFPPNKEDCVNLIPELNEVVGLDKPVPLKSYQDLVGELDALLMDLPKRNITDWNFIVEIFPCSLLLCKLYNLLGRDNLKTDIRLIIKLEIFGNLITSQAYELLGYSIAKREEAKRNRVNVSAKTKKKEEKKNLLITLRDDYLKKHGKLDKEFFRRAMAKSALDTGERTIKNLLKEINKAPA